jgi:hypothetical protein
MYFPRTILAALALAFVLTPAFAADSPPTQEQLRQTVERSLVFLENSAADWKNGNNGMGVDHGHAVFVKGTQAACASCHHVPMTVRCMTEAKNHGFHVSDETVDDFRQWSLWPYLQDPNLTPFNQDKFGKATTSLNTIYLSEALFAADTLDEQATEALKKFAAHLIARQEADGSWKSGRSGYEPPIGDSSEVLTMQALLVLSSADQRGLAGDGWAGARDRALAWLRKNKPDDSNQALNVRTQLAHRLGQPEDLPPLVEELRNQQNADGGWSQLKDRPSDALATGQTLYVLALVGADAQDPAVQRGQAFLTQTQLKDGSWWVSSRDKGRKGLAISHYGSGWATLGLIQTLKTPK